MERVIPIRPESACASLPSLKVIAPRLEGDQRQLMPLVDAVADEIAGPGGPLEGQPEIGAWLRSFRLGRGEAELCLAAELGSCADVMVARVFDVLRRRLHDTDIFVHVEPGAGAGRPAR